MAPILSYQPLKALAITSFLSYHIIFRLPLLIVWHGLLGVKIAPHWTRAETVANTFVYKLWKILKWTQSTIGLRDPRKEATESSLKKTSFVWIPGADDSLVKDVIKHPNHKPLHRLAGYIWPKGGQIKDEPICMHLHGGGYYFLSAHETSATAGISSRIAKFTKYKTVLVPEYRSTQHGPFPCALIDALSTYAYLVQTCKVKPENICIAGDSAGGNLTLALVRYLRDSQVLPLPAKLLLFSPWTDLFDNKTASRYDNLDTSALNFIPDLFLGSQPVVPKDSPYISPACTRVDATPQLFKGFPKTLVFYSEGEELEKDSTELIRKMKLSGVDVSEGSAFQQPHDVFADEPLKHPWGDDLFKREIVPFLDS